MAGVVDDVTDFLEQQGIAGGSTAWALMKRRIMDEPVEDMLVVVAEDGGPAPEMHDAGGIGDSAMRDMGVLVTTRAQAWDSDASRAKAQEVLTALHGRRGSSLSTSTSYLRITAMTPEPIWAGFDDQGRPLHTIAFRLLAEM